jgi:hypothetical protein
MLWAHALAETAATVFPPVSAQVEAHVAGMVEAELRRLYGGHAKDNYGKAKARFDAVAADFVAAAQTVDIEAPAADVVGWDDAQRAAWTAAATLATQIDAELPILTTAASLAGVKDVDTDPVVLALCIDTSGAAADRRRPLWAAWDDATGRRCGRWSALHAAGLTIRACDLGAFAAYRRPEPIQRLMVPARNAPVGVYEERTWDPETQPPPEPPARGLIPGKRMVAR